jgi:hypothetical protein
MFLKKVNYLITNDKFLSIFLFILALFINQHYASRGIFPMDGFAHFDPGYRILNGEYPFRDYWVVHGIFIDYLQALFFFLFGVSWKSYVLHASLLNGLLTVATYFIFRNFNLNKSYSLIYSFFFSVLAYTSSGTPFLDHHSAFFSLLGTYCLILAIDREKKLYWILLPIFFGFAFLSKQVPSAYVILSTCLVLFIYIIIKKRFYCLKYILISSAIFIIIIFIIGKIQGVSLDLFLIQYILFPPSIGLDRFADYKLTFNGIIGHYKFIYLAILPMLYLNIKKIINNYSYINQKDFYFFLTLTTLTLSLIFNQLLTKNQIYIFFLIPILAGFSQIYLKKINLKHEGKIFIAIALICFFSTIKYHVRFNENRKFHELNYVDFNSSVNASLIDKKLTGLNWISPFNKNPNEEINLAKLTKKILKKDQRNKMVITDFQFFSAILNEKLNSPSRTYDLISYPGKKNKYFNKYKTFLLDNIKKKNIKVIYMVNFDNADENLILYDFIDRECLEREIISEELKKFELKKC